MLRVGFFISVCVWLLRAEGPSKSKAEETKKVNSLTESEEEDAFMSIAFVGAPDSGKSETSNRMTGTAKFSVVSHASAEEERKHRHAVESGILKTKTGTSYLILDAPSLSRSKSDNTDLVVQMAHKSEKGIHMFVFVLPYAWISEASKSGGSVKPETDKHMNAFKTFKEMFGKIALQHTALVFTKCEDKREDHIQEEIKEICKERPQEKICAMMLELGLPPLVAIGDMSAKRKARDQDRMIQAAKLIMQKNHWHAYDSETFADVRKERDELQRRIDKLMDSKGKKELQTMLNQVRKGIRDDKELKRIMDQIDLRLRQAEEKARHLARMRPYRLFLYFALISLVIALSIPKSRRWLTQCWNDFISDNPTDESGRKKEWNKKVLLAKFTAALVTLRDPAATKAALKGFLRSSHTRIVQLLRKTAEAAENCSCSAEEEAELGEVQEDHGAELPSLHGVNGSSMYGSLPDEIASLFNRLRKRALDLIKSFTGKGPTRGKGKRRSPTSKAKKVGKSVLPELS